MGILICHIQPTILALILPVLVNLTLTSPLNSSHMFPIHCHIHTLLQIFPMYCSPFPKLNTPQKASGLLNLFIVGPILGGSICYEGRQFTLVIFLSISQLFQDTIHLIPHLHVQMIFPISWLFPLICA